MNRLLIEDLHAGYGAVAVLHDISMQLQEGEFVAVLGTNGNGKSTLLSAILGLVKPTRGKVTLEWDGEILDLTGRQPHEIVRSGIAIVPEGRRLVPTLTVEECLLLAGSSPGGRANMQDNLAFCFETFPVLKERRHQLAGTMSGGQQQLLAIARALMCSPRIVVIDEPSVGLAPIVVSQVFQAIQQLQASRKLTILMAEQSFLQAVDIATRAYVMSHGRIVQALDRATGPINKDEIKRAMMGVSLVS